MARLCSEIPKNRSDHFFGKLVEADGEAWRPKWGMVRHNSVQKFQKIGQTYFLENEHCRLGLDPGLQNEGLII